MFERLHTPEDAFRWKLGAALKMEREIVDMLDELIEESRDEEIREAFRLHQGETKGHVANVEEVFATCGWEVDDSPCPTIAAIEKEGKANIKKSDDAIVDSVVLDGAIETEHHEIAVYESLIVGARALGREDVATLLRRNLEQEEHALAKVRGLAERTAAAAPQLAS